MLGKNKKNMKEGRIHSDGARSFSRDDSGSSDSERLPKREQKARLKSLQRNRLSHANYAKQLKLE